MSSFWQGLADIQLQGFVFPLETLQSKCRIGRVSAGSFAARGITPKYPTDLWDNVPFLNSLPDLVPVPPGDGSLCLGCLDGSVGCKAHPAQPLLYLCTNTASHQGHRRCLICISLARSRADTRLATSLVTREI